jgi:V8-like Glu-specific endopeptidase
MRFISRFRRLARPSSRFVSTSVLAMVVIAFASPANGATTTLVGRMALAVRLSPGLASTGGPQGKSFAGTPAVGALFDESNGKLGSHFCTASVVHSPGGDLLITAAHCVSGHSGQIAFVPGYDNGKTPYGVWTVSRIFVGQAWSSSGSIDDDVAFLQVSPDAAGTPIETVTGAETLGLNQPAGQLTEVVGYPDGAGQPVTCANQTEAFNGSPTGVPESQFDCGGYPDGTSGSPFVAQVDKATGTGTVTGVIGGYEQGGDSPSVSYSISFGKSVGALYQTAVSASS